LFLGCDEAEYNDGGERMEEQSCSRKRETEKEKEEEEREAGEDEEEEHEGNRRKKEEVGKGKEKKKIEEEDTSTPSVTNYPPPRSHLLMFPLHLIMPSDSDSSNELIHLKS
jgi:hypothetical protein